MDKTSHVSWHLLKMLLRMDAAQVVDVYVMVSNVIVSVPHQPQHTTASGIQAQALLSCPECDETSPVTFDTQLAH